MLNTLIRRLFFYIPLSEKQKWGLKCFVFVHFAFIFNKTSFYRKWDFVRRQQAEILASLPEALPVETISRYKPWKIDLEAKFSFDAVIDPVVSIIIPVYNNIGYTHRCLQSIHEITTRHSYEIIVIDDCSTDTTRQVLFNIGGIRLLHNETNQGFIRSCNRGAQAAKGKYLLFLNNDTQVLPGWLDELVDTLRRVPEAGLVGSKLVYPDGRLQEAGGIIWKDANGYNVGRLGNPDAPQYNYQREVDYCSGASILVPTPLFHLVGGFDLRYLPAYCEDSDLAFTIRQAGYKVIYQPRSEVIHFEGISSGTDVKTGVKAYQAVNQKKFYEKWKTVLAEHRPMGAFLENEKERTIKQRILIIDALTPMPDRDAGSVTAYYFCQSFIELGFKVTFLPAHNLNHFGRYTHDLQRIGVECLYQPFVTNISNYLAEQGMQFDVVMLSRVGVASIYLDDVHRYCPKAKVIFNTVDLHFLREERQAALEGSAELAAQAAITRNKEMRVMHKTDATIVLSSVEQELLAREAPGVNTHVIPLLLETPGTTVPFEDRHGLIFVGGYQHVPNVDAVMYFIRECWPLIKAKRPDMTFQIIGSNPPTVLESLTGDGVELVGFVEDLAPFFNAARLSIAPLRYGAGIKGKIGSSLSYGLPCVASRIAAEGMNLSIGKEVLVADEPKRFADLVLALHDDQSLWQSLSDQGLAFVKRHYSLDAGRRKLGSLLLDIGGDVSAPGAETVTAGLTVSRSSASAEEIA